MDEGAMFLPFHRLHSEKEFEGTGVGLAIVKHAPSIDAEAISGRGTTGKGATVYFRLE